MKPFHWQMTFFDLISEETMIPKTAIVEMALLKYIDDYMRSQRPDNGHIGLKES